MAQGNLASHAEACIIELSRSIVKVQYEQLKDVFFTALANFVPEEVLEVGVEPSVEDRVSDGVEHRERVDDEEESQLHFRFDDGRLLDNLEP